MTYQIGEFEIREEEAPYLLQQFNQPVWRSYVQVLTARLKQIQEERGDQPLTGDVALAEENFKRGQAQVLRDLLLMPEELYKQTINGVEPPHNTETL